MSNAITLKSFTELAQALQLTDPGDDPRGPEVASEAEQPAAEDQTSIESLLAELEAADAALRDATNTDREAREAAVRVLTRYDDCLERLQAAEAACARAAGLRQQAEDLAKGAFTDEARTVATRVREKAARAEGAALALVEERRREADDLGRGLDLERLRAERRRQEEEEKARAAAAERAGRLAGSLARAREALGAGRFEEARESLGPVLADNSNHPEIASLLQIIAQQESQVKASAAEETLWVARRELRRDPQSAVRLLERLAPDGLPAALSRQVFGEWARACARLCRERGLAEPLRYAPEAGRGAVLAREETGAYVVVSALGLDEAWRTGNTASPQQIGRSRPLR